MRYLVVTKTAEDKVSSAYPCEDYQSAMFLYEKLRADRARKGTVHILEVVAGPVFGEENVEPVLVDMTPEAEIIRPTKGE